MGIELMRMLWGNVCNWMQACGNVCKNTENFYSQNVTNVRKGKHKNEKIIGTQGQFVYTVLQKTGMPWGRVRIS